MYTYGMSTCMLCIVFLQCMMYMYVMHDVYVCNVCVCNVMHMYVMYGACVMVQWGGRPRRPGSWMSMVSGLLPLCPGVQCCTWQVL